MRKMTKYIKWFFTILLIFLSSVILIGSVYIRVNFSNQNVDEMLYYLFNGMDGASKDVFINAIIECLIPLSVLFIVLILPLIRYKNRKNIVEVETKKKKFVISIMPIKFIRKYRFSYSVALLIISLLSCYFIVGVDDYVNRLSEYSTIFEEYYVDGREISINFPEEKRNLIILYLESMENTMMDIENGGGWKYNVIPELTELAKNNINFSHTDKIGGPYHIPGTEWTVAGMVASTSGIPLKIPVNGNSYTSTENFLAGAYTLGDILQEEGYNLQLMVGSDANFGGRTNYYKTHGDYEIFDVYTAIEEGKMLESEQVWWGFDDSHLFEWAKEELLHLSEQEEPFSFTFLTANTHFTDGYLEENAELLYNTQYENVHAHSSKQVYEFVNWLKEQDFYENTTLVILGDHRSMQPGEFYSSKMTPGYYRTIYSTIINSVIEPIETKNRQFTILDMYPTMLASIGVEIEGERLGLGTNLFSDKNTLAEELGIEYLREELGKNSNFYNKYILKDDYLNLLKQEE